MNEVHLNRKITKKESDLVMGKYTFEKLERKANKARRARHEKQFIRKLYPNVIVIKDYVVYSAEKFLTSEKAEKRFFEECAVHYKGFNKMMDKQDREDMLDDGYFTFSGGSVCLTWI